MIMFSIWLSLTNVSMQIMLPSKFPIETPYLRGYICSRQHDLYLYKTTNKGSLMYSN